MGTLLGPKYILYSYMDRWGNSGGLHVGGTTSDIVPLLHQLNAAWKFSFRLQRSAEIRASIGGQ